MRLWFILIGCGVTALVAVFALAHVLPNEFAFVTPILYGLIVFGGGIGSLRIRRHIEKRDRTAEPDSVERELAMRAGSDALTYTLVVAVAFGLYLVIAEQFMTALAVYGLVVASVILFWIRYAVLRHSVNQDA